MTISTENFFATKTLLFKKIGLKFRNPNFSILYKIAFIFLNKIPTFRSSEINKAIPEQVKVAE